jgi:response regulator RpfG family c-di-GMP phosphodiesterase
MGLPKVLLVDDEQRVLASLTRELMEQEFCEVISVNNGAEALILLKKIPDISVLCSDLRMPGMDGVNLLAEAQKMVPDTIRILLTGAASLDSAVEAVNRGKIFRFLLKPCPSDLFVEVIKAGIRQYQLTHAERDLLSKTLNGSVAIMMDILAALNPEIFSQSGRLRLLARKLAAGIHMEQAWEVELASMLCQIGAVTLPQEVLDHWRSGKELSEQERRMITSIPHMGYQLVKHVPRLDAIALAIEHQDCPYRGRPGSPLGESIPVSSRILKIVLDFDRQCVSSGDSRKALEELLKHTEEYDPFMLEVFRQQILSDAAQENGNGAQNRNVRQQKVEIEDLVPGMILAHDITDHSGRLVIAKGTTITEVLKYRLIYFYWNQSMYEPVLVEDR